MNSVGALIRYPDVNFIKRKEAKERETVQR